MREFCPRKQGVSRGLRPNLLILNKGVITSLSLFKPFSSNRVPEKVGNPRVWRPPGLSSPKMFIRLQRWDSSRAKKTKGQQLKGKIVSPLFHTFWHFSTHFTLFQSFSSRTFLRIKGFYYCTIVQREEKIIKENEEKKTKPFCTLVVARLSSSKLVKSKKTEDAFSTN